MPEHTPRQLTPQSNIEALRLEAKRWHKNLLGGDPAALARFLRAFPRYDGLPALREMQQALAREHGFASWADLKLELEDRLRSRDDNVRLFLDKSVNRYTTNPVTRKWGAYERDDPARGVFAARILERHPEIARDNIHAAVAAHDIKAVQHFLARDPSLASNYSAFDGWPPLCRLAFVRMPLDAVPENALAIAGLLLDAGADPNAGWSDSENPFPPLAGVMGGGESGQAPHPLAEQFARLLLARGADPFVPQALYNTSLGEDSTFWLDWLWNESAKRGESIKWTGPAPDSLGGDKIPSALAYLLGNAVPAHPNRLRWLLEHGADACGINFYSRKPVVTHAAMAGADNVVELLVQHGATRPQLNRVEQFNAAAAAGNINEMRRMAEADPALLHDATVMFVAISQDRADIAAALLDMGMSPDIGDDQDFRALHYTTHCGSVKCAALLMARGAEIDAVEQRYHASPLRHADFQGRRNMIELIAPHSKRLRDLCRAGATERLRVLLGDDPGAVEHQEQPGETLLFCLPGDEELAAEVATLLLSCGADVNVRNGENQTPAEAARTKGLVEAAELMEEAAQQN